MRDIEKSQLGLAIGAVGGLIVVLESWTSVFGAATEPAVVPLVAGLLMIVGTTMFTIGEWKRRAASQ